MLRLFIQALILAWGSVGVSLTSANTQIWAQSKIIPLVVSQPAAEILPPKVMAQVERPDLSKVDWFLTPDVDALPSRVPSTVFDCVGSIHLVAAFERTNYSFRNTALRVEWYNPDGDLELASGRPSYVSFDDRGFRTTGITLRRPQGGGLFSLLDHSAGMERFLGEWQVKVWIADEEIGSLPFSVEC